LFLGGRELGAHQRHHRLDASLAHSQR
jgi:hypothetical protein